MNIKLISRIIVSALIVWLFAMGTGAQEDSESVETPQPQESEEKDSESEDAGAQQDNFVPSEKIRVDTEISFPVDI